MVKEGCADLQHSLAKQPCTGSLSKTSDMTIALLLNNGHWNGHLTLLKKQ